MQPVTKPKSLLRRRPKTIAALLFSLFIVFYLGICVITVVRVKAFRKHPQRSTAVGLFQGDSPHNLLAKLLIFKTGSGSYNSDLMLWASESHVISDRFWNRFILERALTNMPDDQQVDLLPLYPLTPTDRLLPGIKKALSLGRYRALPLLGRMNSADGPEIYRRWVEEKIVKPHDQKLFVASSGVLAESTGYSFTQLLKTFWAQLSEAQKERVTAKIAVHLSKGGNNVNDVFEWAKSSLANGSLKMSCATVALLGRFVSNPSLSNQAIDLVVQHANEIQVAEVDLLFHFVAEAEAPELARVLVERLKEKSPAVVLEVIHHIAHLDILKAEEIAKPYLSAPDSELRKGVIVLLVRHDSVIGKRIIGETFVGSSPRKTMFPSSLAYERGNSASDEYRKLSTHDYKQTGKTWPASYFHTGPSPEEVAGWQQFIRSYPWFPGTDDAYYRLAFSQFAQRNYSTSFATVKEYLAHVYWPDNDAQPYVYHLLRNLAVTSDFSENEMPYLPHLRNIVSHPLVYALMGNSENLDSVIESIDWFLANPQYIRFLNTDVRTLKLMREVAETIQQSPPDSVCRLVAAKLKGSSLSDPSTDNSGSQQPSIQEIEGDEAENDEDADYIRNLCLANLQNNGETMAIYPASDAQSVLYSVFHNFPLPPESTLTIDLPRDPGDEAVLQTARFLNSKFSGLSIDAVQDHSLDELVTLALLNTGPDFERWETEFKPTMDFLAAVNNQDIPSVVAERHLRLVKERGRE